MATVNPFDLLGDNDNDDPSTLIASQPLKVAAKKPAASPAAAPAAAAKLPSKPLPPSQAVKEARTATVPARGGGGRGGPGRGRGGRGAGNGPSRDYGNDNVNGYGGGYGGGGYGGGGYGGGGDDGEGGKPSERPRGGNGPPRQSFRGGRRGGYGNGSGNGEADGDSERPPRRVYERRSGTGRGYEMKREGAGRGNWGTATDDVIAQETEDNVNVDDKVAAPEKQPVGEDGAALEGNKDNKEGEANEADEKPEDKEMTLEEYEKIKEEKRKTLLAMKAEERKVDFDKEFESMLQLSVKKGNDEVFIKLGSDKEKRKENAEKEERAKKSLSINEFLKPTEGTRYYNSAGRGRGRGRGDRGSFRGGFGGGGMSMPATPSIGDETQFPTLGGGK